MSQYQSRMYVEPTQYDLERAELLKLLTEAHPHLDLRGMDLNHYLHSLLDPAHDGQLHSRHVAPEFFLALSVWLVRELGVTDQRVHELLAESAGCYTDEYKPWSPEYSFPLSNDEVRDITHYDSWDALVEALNGGLPTTPFSERLEDAFYVAFGDGESLCWLERYGQSTEGDYPKFMASDFEALKRYQAQYV